jgi:Lon protease-like protein
MQESKEDVAELRAAQEKDEEYAVFCLPGAENLHVGSSLGLHFFEKRYVDMVQEALKSKGQFCYTNLSQTSVRAGVPIMVVKVTQFIERSNGTCDVSATAVGLCLVKEAWVDASTHGLVRVRAEKTRDGDHASSDPVLMRRSVEPAEEVPCVVHLHPCNGHRAMVSLPNCN